MAATAKLLTPQDLAARWGSGIKIGTLANWRCQGRGPPFVKRGAKVLYPLDQLEAWEKLNDQAANDNEPPEPK